MPKSLSQLNALIVRLVTEHAPITQLELEMLVMRERPAPPVGGGQIYADRMYVTWLGTWGFASGGYFRDRLARLCEQGHLTRLFVENRNLYYPSVGFDASDETARKIMADNIEDRGGEYNELLADCLRTAKRGR